MSPSALATEPEVEVKLPIAQPNPPLMNEDWLSVWIGLIVGKLLSVIL